MDDREEITEVPDEVLEFIAGGELTDANRDEIRRYVEWFESKGYHLDDVQDYWVKHMRANGISSFSEQEARDFIASVYDPSRRTPNWWEK
ncbi:MAG: hypothetical protein J6D34_05330 [Atopobiaceae bacterium]|nr:hypothetical protein [Atopobiaceae bacterium]